MEIIDREVSFEKWCPKCKYFELDEVIDPCNDCLDHQYNQYTDKPVEFKEA